MTYIRKTPKVSERNLLYMREACSKLLEHYKRRQIGKDSIIERCTLCLYFGDGCGCPKCPWKLFGWKGRTGDCEDVERNTCTGALLLDNIDRHRYWLKLITGRLYNRRRKRYK